MTKHIVTREIRDNKIRELARVSLSRAATTRWMPGALALAHSSCRRCSSNFVSTRHLTIMNLLIIDVSTAGRDNPCARCRRFSGLLIFFRTYQKNDVCQFLGSNI